MFLHQLSARVSSNWLQQKNEEDFCSKKLPSPLKITLAVMPLIIFLEYKIDDIEVDLDLENIFGAFLKIDVI